MPATWTRMSIRPQAPTTCSTHRRRPGEVGDRAEVRRRRAAGLDDLVHHLRGRVRVAPLAREARAEIVDDDLRPRLGLRDRAPTPYPPPRSRPPHPSAVASTHC